MPVVPEREVCKFIAGVTSLVAKQGALLELKLQRLNRTLTVLVYKRMPDIHNKHLDKNKPRMFIAEAANQTVSKWLQVSAKKKIHGKKCDYGNCTCPSMPY